MIQIDGLTKNAIRQGDLDLLVKHLEKIDTHLIERLKKDKQETRFLQGASHLTDYLLEILK